MSVVAARPSVQFWEVTPLDWPGFPQTLLWTFSTHPSFAPVVSANYTQKVEKMPPTFDLARYPTVETIRLLASLLERMTAANDQLNRATSGRKTNVRRASSASLLASSNSKTCANPPSDNYTRFHARAIPSIDIYSYLARIFKYCPCANECFLSLLVYFDRMSKNALAQYGRPFTIDSYNIHRLIIAGVMVSSKFFSDVFYTNTRYAKVGGLPVAELNSLELEFLVLNNFNLSVPISELQRYGDQLLKVGMIEQEMMKSIMYETPSPFPTPNRHARSTSAGSAALARQDTMPTTKRSTVAIDRLCDMTARVSLDESNRSRMIVFPSAAQPQQQQQQQAAAFAAAASVNAPPVVRRMASLSNLHHSPHYFYNTPMTSTESLHSPVTLDPLEEDADRSSNNSYAFNAQQQQQQQQQHHLSRASPPKNASFDAISYRRPQRHSFVVNGAEVWRHSSSSPPLPQQYTRQRHGSMGYTMAGTTNADGWNQHRLPRQSRSSVNLHQQAGFQRKATPPPPPPSGMMPCPGDLNEAGAAVSGTYGPYYHPMGIPTPPPSSSPVHYYKPQGNTPSPYSSSVTMAATAAGCHPSNPTSVMYL